MTSSIPSKMFVDFVLEATISMIDYELEIHEFWIQISVGEHVISP